MVIRRPNSKESYAKGVETRRSRDAYAILKSPVVIFLRKKMHNAAMTKKWLLVSPKNESFEFYGLAKFIDNNENKFDPIDTLWRIDKRGNRVCSALNGLASLRPTHKRPRGTWKGWRWKSIEERTKEWCGIDQEEKEAIRSW